MSILVNNVGILPNGRIDELNLSTAVHSSNININAQTYMSLYMLKRKRREFSSQSAIITLSSKAAHDIRGFMPLYCATKRYNLALSQALAHAHPNFDILAVTPASVATQMNKGDRPYTVSASACAKSTIDQLGWTRETWGSPWHAF